MLADAARGLSPALPANRRTGQIVAATDETRFARPRLQFAGQACAALSDRLASHPAAWAHRDRDGQHRLESFWRGRVEGPYAWSRQASHIAKSAFGDQSGNARDRSRMLDGEPRLRCRSGRATAGTVAASREQVLWR